MQAIVFAEAQEASPILAGVPVLERLLRSLERSGVRQVTLVSRAPDALLRAMRGGWARKGLSVTTRTYDSEIPQVRDVLDAWPEAEGDERVLVFPALGIFDSRLITPLAERDARAALVDSAAPEEQAHLHASAAHGPWGLVCGPSLVDRAWLREWGGDLAPAVAAGVEEGSLEVVDVHTQPSYLPSLRRKLRPLWFDAPATEGARAHGEDLLLEAATKKVLDLPAHVYAPFENLLVRLLWHTRVTAGQLSFVTGILAAAATALFALDELKLGVAVAIFVGLLLMTSGKLARVKLEPEPSEGRRRWVERAFEASWALAIATSLLRAGLRSDALSLFLLLVAAEAADSAVKHFFLHRWGKAIDDVDGLDRTVRLVGGRRDVYLWIFAAGFLPQVPAAADAFAAVVHWAVATAAVHAARAWWLLTKRLPVHIE